MRSLLFGERSITKVAALFGRAEEARTAAAHVVEDGRLPESQVEVVGPGDLALEHKLEPEDRGIFRTMIKAHITFGIVGLILGVLLAGALIFAGVGFAVFSPYYAVGAAAVFGLMGGLMLGGLVTLRPDHTVLITKVEAAVHEGHWAVVVHPRNHGQERRALNVLEHSGGEVLHTL